MILITGALGYIGSNCVIEFLKNGYDTVLLDDLSTGHIQIKQRLESAKFKGKIIDCFKVDMPC